MTDYPPREFRVCNCACQRCLGGSCCQFPDLNPESRPWRTWTTTTTSPIETCYAADHDFAVLDPARLFCRRCGTTKKV